MGRQDREPTRLEDALKLKFEARFGDNLLEADKKLENLQGLPSPELIKRLKDVGIDFVSEGDADLIIKIIRKLRADMQFRIESAGCE